MPAASKSQQRLMGQAYAVRKFLDGDRDGLDPKDVDPKYREEIVRLAKDMKKKDLEDFAKTKHEKGMPDRVEENSPTATVHNVNGIGAHVFPRGDSTGSGILLPFAEWKAKEYDEDEDDEE